MKANSSHHAPGRPPLTQRQAQVMEAIAQAQAQCGCPPTIRELAVVLSLKSTNSVAGHLQTLGRKGYLEKMAHKSRTWRLVDAARPGPPPTRRRRERVAQDLQARQVPLVGQVAAGLPALAIEQAEESITIDAHFLPRSCRDVFALRVVGESMCEAGIHPRDIVLVERQSTAQAGSIVVALLGEEATIKRYRPDLKSRTVRLEPANAAMSPIVLPAEQAALLRIIGVVVGVWRRLG